MNESSRILVIRTGAIGDTIVMSVVFQALRRHYPNAYIEAVGAVERLKLINTPGLIDRVTSSEWSVLAELFIENLNPSRLLLEYVQPFDIILLYSVDKNTLIQNLCKICAHRVYRFDPFPPKGAKLHITRYLLGTLAELNIFESDILPEINFPKNGHHDFFLPESFEAEMVPEAFRVAIHPGSGSVEKNWDAARFTELCRRFKATIVIITGPAERDMGEIIRAGIVENACICLDDVQLSTVVQVLRACHLYIGNDSGISHLAAAIGIPTIALFGPSDPEVWKPLGKHVTVLQKGKDPYCAGISVEYVFAEVQTLLNRRNYS